MILTNSHKLLLAALAFIPLLSIQPVRAQTESVTNTTAATVDPYAYESSYDRYMRLGYAAYKERDYPICHFLLSRRSRRNSQRSRCYYRFLECSEWTKTAGNSFRKSLRSLYGYGVQRHRTKRLRYGFRIF
jgi:hypothetical protein